MNTFLLVFNALPAILQSVQAVEAAIPISQAGKQKLDMVLGAAETAWEIAQAGKHISKSDAMGAVQSLTNLAVAGLNATGIFKHGTPVSSK